MLVNKARDWINSNELSTSLSNPLARLLEIKNESGKTALLIACQMKNCALIELLVEAGADLKAVDQDKHTAIYLVASSPTMDEIPSKDFSPAINKVSIVVLSN